ncbi:MAG: GTP 3',8-cyclase MoaA [Acidobacteriota bacterium]
MRPAPGGSGPAVYVRLSITDRCDLRCLYCRARGPAAGAREGGAEALSAGELARLMGVVDGVAPVRKVRLTGGEPLLRDDVVEVVAALRRALPGAAIAMTTNGRRLPEAAAALGRAGLDAVNVSLDVDDERRYAALTGGSLAPVLEGLEAARAAGLGTIKLNAVLLASYNADRLAEVVRLAARYGAEPRFIELMPSGPAAELHPREYVSAGEALERLGRAFEPRGSLGRSGAAERYAFRDGDRTIVVGLITPVSSPFCAECDRLRLDARGRLLACLRRSESTDLGGPLRRGDDAAVRRTVLEALAAKRPPEEGWACRDMSAIGG